MYSKLLEQLRSNSKMAHMAVEVIGIILMFIQTVCFALWAITTIYTLIKKYRQERKVRRDANQVEMDEIVVPDSEGARETSV